MKHNISNLDKSKLLVALFNNAKKSQWTAATIKNKICPDPWVYNLNKDRHDEDLSTQLSKLELTETEAQKLLASSKYIDYIGPVLIKIDFSKPDIDTTLYDADNHKFGEPTQSAHTVISELRNNTQTLLTTVQQGAIKGAKYGTLAAISVAGIGLFATNSAIEMSKSGPAAPAYLLPAIMFTGLTAYGPPIVLALSIILCTSVAAGKHCLFGPEENNQNRPGI